MNIRKRLPIKVAFFIKLSSTHLLFATFGNPKCQPHLPAKLLKYDRSFSQDKFHKGECRQIH